MFYTNKIINVLNKKPGLKKSAMMQGLLWLPKSRSQKNRQVPFSGASFKSQEPV